MKNWVRAWLAAFPVLHPDHSSLADRTAPREGLALAERHILPLPAEVGHQPLPGRRAGRGAPVRQRLGVRHFPCVDQAAFPAVSPIGPNDRLKPFRRGFLRRKHLHHLNQRQTFAMGFSGGFAGARLSSAESDRQVVNHRQPSNGSLTEPVRRLRIDASSPRHTGLPLDQRAGRRAPRRLEAAGP